MKNRVFNIFYCASLCFLPFFLQSQNKGDQYSFDIDFSYTVSTDSTVNTLISVVSTSNEEILISLSKNTYINEGDEVYISTSYSGISDPLLMPKLGMPWNLLASGDTILFTDILNCTRIKKATVDFDYLPLGSYPYKKLKSKSRREYWYTRVDKNEEIELIYLSLIDYYTMLHEEGTIKTLYEKINLE